MYYVLGLENPGEKYQDTPHNIGGDILELMYQRYADVFTNRHQQGKAEVAESYVDGVDMQYIFSGTFMNHSGQNLAHVPKQESDKVIVIHDDIDLPFGQIRIAYNRGDGGHNGIKDVVRQLGTKAFIRIRIGVQPFDILGRPRKPKGGRAVNNYLVYKRLSKKYRDKYSDLADQVHKAIYTIASEGREKAMNKFN